MKLFRRLEREPAALRHLLSAISTAVPFSGGNLTPTARQLPSEVDSLDTDPASARLLPVLTLCELGNLGSDRDRSFQLRSTSRWAPQNRAR